ncbi:MAG: UDP-N-acetylmuramoyl-tripeptide--D-alanyl-D-alanine ligase [Chitinophagaceae bacterium]|nr:UDP-N-acetylmuramoyl-tripeptide--D-alanyl-D-alanine ligase [Chitinophagaceae bacterium]
MVTIEQLYAIYLKHPSVQTDTRKLQAGDLFFALKGENFNGNLFAEAAIKNGASYAIVDEKEYAHSPQCILVDNVLDTLQQLALYHRETFNIPFIAITGSNGKTTTKELMYAVLSSTFKTYATQGNLNNHIGIPLTLLSIKRDAEMAIIEMGANHQKEIASYCQYVKPTHALINNCGKAHLEGFGGIEGVRKGKGELYDYIRQHGGVIFKNADLDYLNEMASGITNQITYGKLNADYTYSSRMEHSFLQVSLTAPRMECTIHTHLVGEYNAANVMAAVAVGHTFKIPVDVIRRAIEAYMPDNSRSQLIQRGNNTIIMDAYNANPSSMYAAIKNFEQLDDPNKVVMLGGMMELGPESIQEHRRLVDLLMESNWHHVILVGGDFQHIDHPYLYFKDALAAKEWFDAQHFNHATILIKGSRAFTMEKIIQ